jgi:hypothetical protein
MIHHILPPPSIHVVDIKSNGYGIEELEDWLCNLFFQPNQACGNSSAGNAHRKH